MHGEWEGEWEGENVNHAFNVSHGREGEDRGGEGDETPPLWTFRGNTPETHSPPNVFCVRDHHGCSLSRGPLAGFNTHTPHTHARSRTRQGGSPPLFARLLRPRAQKKTYPSDGVVMALMGPPDADPEWLSRSPRAESCQPTGLTENGIDCPAPNDCSRRLLLCGKKRLPWSSCPCLVPSHPPR